MTGPEVAVRGEAELRFPPDRVTVWVTVHSQGRAVASVRDELARGSARIAILLADHADAVESHATSQLAVVPVFDSRRSAPTGHRGSLTVTVVLNDVEALSGLLPELIGIGEVGGPSWSLRPGHPGYAEVRRAAIADGRRRAEDYAAAFGARLTGLVEIADVTERAGFPTSRRAMLARGAPAPEFEIEPAEQVVSGQVSLRFSLSEPDLSADR